MAPLSAIPVTLRCPPALTTRLAWRLRPQELFLDEIIQDKILSTIVDPLRILYQVVLRPRKVPGNLLGGLNHERSGKVWRVVFELDIQRGRDANCVDVKTTWTTQTAWTCRQGCHARRTRSRSRPSRARPAFRPSHRQHSNLC